ncbi:MAG: oxygen-independent coproporphyrinogen III oxidase [Rhizobiales bacterium 24-66-13]|jgi:oxygen-independent coproporphyrinogen-3 oxidase|nr:MAG: oxygen-independent coproporphyrinogen III oxidase [Rhizobiales bacterium 35-66-30]OYZ78087.1 MAG: oxygen-independent coproporphyrinogen III oxidase [Rhizobiales bacterium 24-66-13]OZA98067.1 MAG: oxygen-independent coproporphyrinogen III oxidase [Rhizobiales bacterium 39-66-18]HQS45893.1 oxygen-independent coproporphyrinogen III oxidase [Xanthobacteraceae bacterium]
MNADLLARAGRPVPRYTSYPTAPHFGAEVDAATYAGWLAAVPPDATASLYLHVPFCAELCFYCGCHTTVARGITPLVAYAARLEEEIALVTARLPGRLEVGHLHWGGGTPTMLGNPDFLRLMALLRTRFAVRPDAEIAIEIDPRVMDQAKVDTLASAGINRASLGVQDFDPKVQEAIGRRQSFAETAAVADALRKAGIGAINLDLIYGLPHQTTASVTRTLNDALALEPSRIAVFGYAHVPWMKKHQALISEATLPGPAARLEQAETISCLLNEAGYVSIGLDHFARPGDAMAERAEAGTLKRNFQGYTTDDAPVLLSFGPSAIGALPQGYVQNLPATPHWHQAVARGELPIARGRALTADDRLRRAVIERLMCDLSVDLDAVCAAHGTDAGVFAQELGALAPLIADGLAVREGSSVRVPETARAFTRTVCAVFDAYLAPHSGAAPDAPPAPRRHAAAV